MTKREERKLESKTREWDKIVRGWNNWWKKAWKWIKKQIGELIRFTFCFQPKDNLDLMLHILFIISLIYVYWYARR